MKKRKKIGFLDQWMVLFESFVMITKNVMSRCIAVVLSILLLAGISHGADENLGFDFNIEKGAEMLHS